MISSQLEQARRIVKEGSRFNLAAIGSSFDRTINLPMAALAFLRAGNQSRSSFSRESFENVGAARTAVVSFKETGKPRLIGSPDEAAASGKFWIELTTGQVRRSLLSIESRRGTTVVVASDYAEVPSLRLWLPKLMEEDYQFTNSATRQLVGVMVARANYSNYRKFKVDVSEKPAQ